MRRPGRRGERPRGGKESEFKEKKNWEVEGREPGRGRSWSIEQTLIVLFSDGWCGKPRRWLVKNRGAHRGRKRKGQAQDVFGYQVSAEPAKMREQSAVSVGGNH